MTAHMQPDRSGDSVSRPGQVSTPGPLPKVEEHRVGLPQAGHAGAGLPAEATSHTGLIEGRRWVLDFPPGMTLLNANDRLHRMAEARIIAEIRAAAGWLAKVKKVPRLQRARFDGFYEPQDRRQRDAANWAPTAKAAVDGVVGDAHVLPNDSSTYLDGPFPHIGEIHKPSRFVLVITELLDPPETAS